MNIMLDTNVVLDDILNRMPNAISAKSLIDMIAEDKISGYISANSITDIYYIAGKHLGNFIAKEIIRDLLINFHIVSVGGQDCLDALDLPMADFEDALVVVCAKNARLDYIVTNDKGVLGNDLPVPPISPSDFLTTIPL